ncbi:hypothetical protein CPU12_00935 [Malaciobacter molluscorum LMG 25693]|uniref:Membrane protein n=1 Tax=Malaciobacter molluscorum LMG 25693 TaxID=870501 RepID=A0A2G1DLI9_9BACT|nr:hypothetical protein [Malaciobacter molluscorum]AXX92144.1 putative membrane protein [Malaciobacter molluscorum LMG 25693]PHO19373.1 hypothetical protein CPU12_00935 [Malaciobacter molluscorum LMG 25693]
MVETSDKNLLEKVFSKLNQFDKVLENKIDIIFLRIINLLKHLFILSMILYLAICIISLSHKMISLTLSQGALDFVSIKMILTDGLFTLIVLAIVKTLFIKSGFEYALTFLEIAFVVIIRKLILLDTVPEETSLLLVLGITSSIFFILIVYINNLKRSWMKEDKV